MHSPLLKMMIDNEPNDQDLNKGLDIPKVEIQKDFESHDELMEKNGMENKNEGNFNKENNHKNSQNLNDANIPKDSKKEIDMNQIQYDLSNMNTSVNLDNENIKENEKNINFLAKKTKRPKSNGTNKTKKHTKNDCDNRQKKVKGYIFKYLVITMNSFIKKYKSKKTPNYKLKRLTYKKVEQLKLQLNRELLKMPIKDVLSIEISGKYKSDTISNKEIIDLLLEKEKNNPIINEILNIKFLVWLVFSKDIKIYKKGKIIRFEGVEELLKEIRSKNNDEEYISDFKKSLDKYEVYFEGKRGKK